MLLSSTNRKKIFFLGFLTSYFFAVYYLAKISHEESFERIEKRIHKVESDLDFVSKMPHFTKSLKLRTSIAARDLFDAYMDSRFAQSSGSAIKAFYVFDNRHKEIVAYKIKKGAEYSYSSLSFSARTSDPVKPFVEKQTLFLVKGFADDRYSLTAVVNIPELVGTVKGVSGIRMAYWGKPVPFATLMQKCQAAFGKILAVTIAYLLVLISFVNPLCLCGINKKKEAKWQTQSSASHS